MATGDKLVTFDMAKVMNDDLNGKAADLKSAVIDNEKNATGALTGLKSQFEGAIKSNILLNLSTLTKTVKTTERYVHNDFVLGAEPNTKYCFSFGTIDNKLSNVLAVAIFQDANGTQLSSTNINASYGEITSPEGAVKLLFQVYFVLNVYPSATTEITYHDIIVTKDTGTQTFMLNGTHPDLTAGTASQILSKTTVEDQVPYTFRKTGGGQSVGDRATLDKIVGGTVAWNQLGKLNPSSSTSNGITWTPTDDGIVANGTATADSTYGGITQQDLVSGHVYAVFGCPANGSMSTYRILVSNSAATGNPGEFGNGIMFRAKTGASSYLSGLVLCVTSGATVNSIKFKPQLFDLTKMFGATIADYIYSLETATAGAGVAWFRQLFPLDYYDYNPGELISVSGVSARETVGFNAWDEVSETGAIDITTGANVANNDVSRSKNYIPLLANATYCYTNKNSSSGIRACFYDSSKNYIGYLSNNNPVPQTFVVPSNAAYMRFYASNVSAICINLSDSSRNGEYEPYEKHSYSLDSSLTLRGIPKLDAQNRLYWDGDEYTPDGKVARRYDTVIMDGTENWVKYRDAEPNTGYYSYYCNPFGNKLPHESWNTDYCFRLTESDYNPKGNNGNDVYNQTGINSAIDRTGNFMVCAKGISTVADFKAWVASVHLGIVYLLKESTTETAAEYQDIQIVDPYGTESFVTDGIVPVGHVTQYHENLREKIEQLPADFSTLIAPVEKTFVATRPYTSGALLIVNNVLYKATASIANGATITPGTNCTPTTLAAIIAALQ